jgi:DUF4097 and DUF4098 domain-containing protein YvlB
VQPRMLWRASRVAGVALFSVSLGACDLAISGFHEEARDSWAKSYPISADGRLEIVNTNGSIQVEPGDASQVEVHAERIARSATQQGAKDLLQKVEVREEADSGRVHLEMRVPHMVGFHGGIEVKYTVRVPRRTAVDLRETNGQLEVTGLAHDTRLSTTNGHIACKKLNGEVHVSTTNGRVDLQMASVTQDIEAETTNGSIALQVPTDASADISARVTNGHIGVEGLPSVKAEDDNSRRRYSGRLNGGGHAIRLQTTNGSITVSGGSAGSTDAGKSEKGDKKEPVER